MARLYHRQAVVTSYAVFRWKSGAIPILLEFAGLHELEASGLYVCFTVCMR